MKTRILLLVLFVSALLAQVTPSNALKTVTTAGTAVRLTASSTVVRWATVQALSTNTGTVCVGGSGVVASTRSGTCLTAGLAAPLFNMPGFPYDLSLWFVDSTVSGEGVAITYAQ